MRRTKVIAAGLLAGFIAAIAMTVMMLLLAYFGVATPLVIIGDRLSVFIPPGPFLSLMGKVGGYNHLKQLGVGSTIAGQLLFGAIGGAIFGFSMRRNPSRRVTIATIAVFVACRWWLPRSRSGRFWGQATLDYPLPRHDCLPSWASRSVFL